MVVLGSFVPALSFEAPGPFCLPCLLADPVCALHLCRPSPWHEHLPVGLHVCAHFLGHIKGVVVEDCVIDMDLLLHSLFILKFFKKLVPYLLLYLHSCPSPSDLGEDR